MIKQGDRVAVDYIGRFETGEVFDTSTHEGHTHPLLFVVGSGQVIKGFDDAVVGMQKGERKTFTISAHDAYGDYRNELKQDVPASLIKLPRNQLPKEGMMLMMKTPEGHPLQARVIAVKNDTVTLDLNHPLAGKTLVFEIVVVGINDAMPASHPH